MTVPLQFAPRETRAQMEIATPRAVRMSPTHQKKGLSGRIRTCAHGRNCVLPNRNQNATVSGAGGENYVNIFASEDNKSRPPKPTLTIVEAGGKTVASGNLEYG